MHMYDIVDESAAVAILRLFKTELNKYDKEYVEDRW